MSERFGFGPFPPVPPMTGTTGYSGNWPQAGPPGPELIAVVSNILNQLQGQGAGGPQSTASGASANGLTPLDEQRAAEAFLRDLSAGSLRKLYRYLEHAAGRQADVTSCYPTFHQAVRAWRARDFGQALNGCFQIYRMIAVQQSHDFDLPDVPDEAEPASPPDRS